MHRCLHNAHLSTDNQPTDHTAPNDDRLKHIETVQGGNERILHFLVVLDGLVKVAALKVLVAEVLDCLVVQQCICCFGRLCIVKAIQIPDRKTGKMVSIVSDCRCTQTCQTVLTNHTCYDALGMSKTTSM